MTFYSTGRYRLFLLAFILVLQVAAYAQYPCPGWSSHGDVASKNWSYSVKLDDASRHLLHITMKLDPTSPDLQVQLPAWNSTYQVRDFAEHLNWLRARDIAGNPAPVRQIDKTTWSVPNAATVEYEIVAVDSGPFGAEFNGQHAFLNLAQVLIYPVAHTGGQVLVSFDGIPNTWKIATPLRSSDQAFCADNYDHLVDSPIEIGNFREFDFEQDGAQYRVIVHSDDTYNADAITSTLRKIVAAETDWMHDRPYQQYTFFYHLPHGSGRGGMEHAYSTAIEISAGRLADNSIAFASVSAHEFFHLWNVKRIRPQSMEPVDYTKENYTRALWFSEGVDSAIADIMLMRAGLIDEKTFLARLAGQIGEFEIRPARKTQSVEESSLDAWLEKYPYYRSAARSVNYYNKGQIVGVLLDLKIRESTQGRKSLRDLFQWMNEHYARQGKFFDDSRGVREAAQAITGANFEDFFDRCVSGTAEISYNDFFRTVGLALNQKQVKLAYAGFATSLNFGPTPVVTNVDSGSDAEKAGLRVGDIIQSVNSEQPSADVDSQIADLAPDSTLKLKVSTRDRSREIKIKLAEREETQYEFTERPDATPASVARRKAWMRGDSEFATPESK